MNETPGGPSESQSNDNDPPPTDEQPPAERTNSGGGPAGPYQQHPQAGPQSVAYGPSGSYGQRQSAPYQPQNAPGAHNAGQDSSNQNYPDQTYPNQVYPNQAHPPQAYRAQDGPSPSGASTVWPPTGPAGDTRPAPRQPERAARSGSMPGPAVPAADQPSGQRASYQAAPSQQRFSQQAPVQQGQGQPAPAQRSATPDRSGEAGYATDDLVTMLQPSAPPRARRGWRAFFHLPPSQREQREFAQLDSVRSQFARPVTLMIANPKGGTGKTPISLLLAGEFGEARGGGVVVIDNNENRGTAAFRSYFPHRRTVADLLDHADELEKPEAQFTDLAYFLAHQTTGKYYVLASDESVTRELDEQLFARVHRILSRFFAVIIIDSGNNELASNWLAALDVADGLIVPTQWRQDHVVTANKMLKTLRDRQHPVLARTMIIGTNAPAAEQATPKKAAYEWFSGQHHLQVVEIPTDPHIHEGGVLDRAKMSAKTRRAALAAASVASFLIVDVADSPPRSRSPRPGETG